MNEMPTPETRPARPALRPARDRDAPAVLRLLEGAKLEAAFDPAEFTVAEEDGALVACARLRRLPDGTHELASVAVSPSHRGRRLGERIVAEALHGARATVYALALAPGFFQKQGFQRLPETPALLASKAEGTCASSGFVPMAWHPGPQAAVADIQRRYAQVASTSRSCCDASGAGCCGGDALHYTPEELAAIPAGAHLNLGTGNPVRAARLQPGETVLDLGSGAGVDVLLAARAVGPKGLALGVDFTPEMVARARENARAAGLGNATFHEAPIEALPLADASVDVVTSNCVVNLSIDKPAVLREAFRVLRPGGRFVVSDTLRLSGDGPARAPSCDCETGAFSPAEWIRELEAAGFQDVSVQPEGRHGAAARGIVRARRPD